MENTGDDALLAATFMGVKNYLRPEHICATATQIPNIVGGELVAPLFSVKPRFRGENGLRAYFGALRSNCIVFGGGSVFHSSSYLRKAMNFLKFAGKGPHAAVGVGLGPFADKASEQNCAELLKHFQFVGLRDRQSYEIAKIMAPSTRCEKTFDLAPMLLRSIRGQGITPQKTSISPRKGVGLALCDYERYVGGNRICEQTRRKKIKIFLDQLDPSLVDEIVLLDFNGHSYYGDSDLHQEIGRHVNGRFKVIHKHYDSNPLNVLTVIKGLEVIVAMRLHAAIFGYLTMTPTALLSYHPKCLGWAEDVGIDKECIYDSVDFDPAQLAAFVKNAISGQVEMPLLPLEEAEKLAFNNWSWLDE